jgi:hypothetical protein
MDHAKFGRIETGGRYFQCLAIARSARDRAHKIEMIVLGDDMRYWLMRPADAERLARAGYEILE